MLPKAKCFIAILLFSTVLGAQTKTQGYAQKDGNLVPDLKQCEALATEANDPSALLSRPADDMKALNWELGLCLGKFGPTNPTGTSLILSAYGTVADVYRLRIEKAIKILPPQEQAKVWAAFRNDKGTAK